MAAFRPSVGLTVFRLEDRVVPAAADPVLTWNTVALDAVRDDHGLTALKEQGGPLKTARTLAIVQTAVYDAVNSIDRTYTPYLVSIPARPGASIDAAVAYAAHDTLVALYPSRRATFDRVLADAVDDIPAPAAQAGAEVGRQTAAAILADRAADGSAAKPATPYVFGTGPVDWRSDPTGPQQTAYAPLWGDVKPFTAPDMVPFEPAPPPRPGSDAYRAAYAEVRALGGDGVTTPTARTADQTEAGLFWGYDGQPGLGTPPRLYNQIVARIARDRGNTVVENARLFALVNMAAMDAGISSWGAKYDYNYGRPVTVLRGDDGDPATAADPTWTPYGAPAAFGGANFTPPFPSYTSGHATFGGATFETLRRFYGTDNIPFTFTSDELNGVTRGADGRVRPLHPRSFATLTAAEAENAQSRIYLGIHWQFDAAEGMREGRAVADAAADRLLRVRPELRRTVAGAAAGGGPRVQLFDGRGAVLFDFFAFDPSFRGGVTVAQGDVTGDGVPDLIAAAGPGGGGRVRVFDGTTAALVREFTPFEAGYDGGLNVAAGDINGDRVADIIVGAGSGGGPRVRVLSGADGSTLRDYFAFDAAGRGGVTVAAGDLDGDGVADLVTGAGAGASPAVVGVSGLSGAELFRRLAYAPDYRGGVFVAAGDCDGDGRADVVTGAMTGAAHVNVFTPAGDSLASYFALGDAGAAATTGVRVGIADPDGDGRDGIVSGTGPGGRGRLETRGLGEGVTATGEAFDADFRGGVAV